MYEEKINAYFDAPERRAELVEAISRLVRIRSVREEPLPGMPFGPGPAAALDELHNGKDFVAVHVEAPDECTHNGDLPGKLQAIEWLDSRVIGSITQALADEGTDFRLLILSDHKTLTATRGHDADPVPYLLYDSRKDTGLNLPYCEESGLKGTAYAAGAPVLMRKLFEQL